MLRPAPRPRYVLIETPGRSRRGRFREPPSRRGSRRREKSLPCRFLYDARGSKLFEAICQTPEYYLTRAEHEILDARADAIAARFGEPITLAELGSGSARKTRLLIEAFLARHAALRYVPVDISRGALEASARSLLARYPGLEVRAIASEYREGLRLLREATAGPKLVLWLGSNVGNFDRAEAAGFLRPRAARARAQQTGCCSGSTCASARELLEAAYDDARGVTARFTRNLLVRINRELGGSFAPAAFAHRARWLEDEGKIEIHLVSRRRSASRSLRSAWRSHFAQDEAIHMEDSFKYSPAEIDALLEAASLR